MRFCYEQSGNGSGQRCETGADFDQIGKNQEWINESYSSDSPEEFMDGDNRKKFLRGQKSHVLCY